MQRIESFEIERFRLPCFEHPERVAKLRTYLLQRRKTDPGLQRSNRGGWQSSDDLHTAPLLAPVNEELLSLARVATGAGKIKIASSWGNVSAQGDWVRPHVHLGWRVAILMVQPVQEPTLQDEGALMVLEHPGVMNPILPAPQQGEVVMFPGDVVHMVAPHQQSSPRITLAYNLKPVA